MSKWRPEGWFDTVHHRPDEEGDDGVYESDWDDGYEAGADAMLAALKLRGEHWEIGGSCDCGSPDGAAVDNLTVSGKSGTLVFIPDKE